MAAEPAPIDPLDAAIVALAELYAGMAVDEALAAELGAGFAAPDRAPLYATIDDI